MQRDETVFRTEKRHSGAGAAEGREETPEVVMDVVILQAKNNADVLE